jgi:phage tail-like protein
MVQRVDTYMNFRFRVELDGIQQAGFMECSGLGSQVEVVEYEGNDVTRFASCQGMSHTQILC